MSKILPGEWSCNLNMFLTIFVCYAEPKVVQPKNHIIHFKSTTPPPSPPPAGATKRVKVTSEETREKKVEVEVPNIEGVTRSGEPEKVFGEANLVESTVASSTDVGKVGSSSAACKEPSLIWPDDTPDDYYYRSYGDCRAGEARAPIWKLKQGDTFVDFSMCREWFRGAFPLLEVNY
ncbi:hypothetical protein Hanom_Chr02g00130911 [Helianthus anomalus]